MQLHSGWKLRSTSLNPETGTLISDRAVQLCSLSSVLVQSPQQDSMTSAMQLQAMDILSTSIEYRCRCQSTSAAKVPLLERKGSSVVL